MKILLVRPGVSGYYAPLQKAFGKRSGNMTPLALATVAALTPDDVEVDIWDEAVNGTLAETALDIGYDLVGVTGYETQIKRARLIGRMLRQRGIPAVVGGPGVSASPELYRQDFDVLFIGEAEHTWPEFIRDWKTGRHRSEYRQVSKVDMAVSPLPRWDKIDIGRYSVGGVQTTRGCPFDCEFCDVIYIYGRQARHKPIDRVLAEITALQNLGAEGIFLCDDNFIGDPSYAKSLLKELAALNRSFRQPVAFFTQITLNVAKDDALLEALVAANFTGLYIGIETPNIESLIEMNKPQNYRTDIVRDVKKIQSYGLPIMAGMIVGFDHDDITIFDRHFDFLQETGIATPQINMLKAPRGTKLWIRLHKEGRVVEIPDLRPEDVGSSDLLTNILPKRMTRLELLTGYRGLIQRVRDWQNFEARIKTMISVARPRAGRRSRPSVKQLFRGVKVLAGMDREARRVTLRLLLHTRRRAPFMMPAVVKLTVLQYLMARRLPVLLDIIDKQIRIEAEGAKLQREGTVFFVPDGFKKPYRAVFPELYERVYRGLSDKSRVPGALAEATYDFLTRWGPSFDEFADHHRTFLDELCDRSVAKENAESHVSGDDRLEAPPLRGGTESASEREAAMRLRQLADEVLRVVEQDLRSFQPRESTVEPPGRDRLESSQRAELSH
jgi:radical SAM superfamily enzyme YgiQ (UPF0313 family)